MELSPGLNYTFRILAFNRVGMSEPSEYTECASPGLPPDHSPENVTVVPGDPGTLIVSWQVMSQIFQKICEILNSDCISF